MTGPDYCKLADVTGRLYAGQGLAPGDPIPQDATRDTLLQSIITATSRDFDHEVDERFVGLFAPTYGSRVFSGKGMQELEIDAILVLTKLEINSTPGRTPTWQDYTSELATYQMGLLPAGEGWPKHSIFRQASFYVDPFPTGNVRATGLWGICLPDVDQAQPKNPWQGVDPSTVAPPGGGWWVTPDDVVDAVASWSVYRFESSKAAYAEEPGSSAMTGTAQTKYPKDIPGEVARIITRYNSEDANHPKLALVGNDGDQQPTGYRWAGWMTQ